MKYPKKSTIGSFDFVPGKIIAKKYELLELLGAGWEGEVYKIKETHTGIERTAKFFFPHRNINNKTSTAYAKKLHFLKDCSSVIHYHHQENIIHRGTPIAILISEYVEGRLLSEYLSGLRGKRLLPFQALHLLYALVQGVESIHNAGEYHGDLHSDNIIIQRHGLSYDLKLMDLFHWGKASRANRDGDICNLIQIFHEALGGQKVYASLPLEIKKICCGLKRSLILKKFRTISVLKAYLENMNWQ